MFVGSGSHIEQLQASGDGSDPEAVCFVFKDGDDKVALTGRIPGFLLKVDESRNGFRSSRLSH